MDTLIVTLIVLTAVGFIGRKVFLTVRTARKAKAGCVDCGCGNSGTTGTDWSKS